METNAFLAAQFKSAAEFYMIYHRSDLEWWSQYKGKELIRYALSNENIDARYEVTEFLIDEGFDTMCLDDHGQTLLHILCAKKEHDLVKTTNLCEKLINARTDINALDDKNRLAFQYMIESPFTDQQLERLYHIWFHQEYVDLYTKNDRGQSLLDLAQETPGRELLVKKMNQYLRKFEKKGGYIKSNTYTVEYIEGCKKMILDIDLRENYIDLHLGLIEKWQPPFDEEELSEKDKKRILKKLYRYFKYDRKWTNVSMNWDAPVPLNQHQIAEQDMITWLTERNGLGREPSEIECTEQLYYHGMCYYLFKFKTDPSENWMLGVSGGFEAGSLKPCGHTFSDMRPYCEETFVKDAVQMIDRVVECWKEREKR